MLMLLTATKTQNVTATALWGSGLVTLIDSAHSDPSFSPLSLSLAFIFSCKCALPGARSL